MRQVETSRDDIEMGEGEGNTNSPSPISKPNKVQDVQRKYWAFTIFNFLETGETLKQWFMDNTDKCVIGLETCPTTQKQHLQGFMALKRRQRLSQLKKTPLKNAHLEPCIAGEEENIAYCTKDNNVWFMHPKPKAPLKIITNLRPFQNKIETMILEEPDDRKIIWAYDEKGSKGKSAFCRYLIHKHKACYLTEGKKSDLLNIVYNYCSNPNNDLNLVVVDIPRSNQNVSYKSLEEIKNGIICNTKYETGTLVINHPHIVVFANFLPDYSQFSEDRWEVYNITDDYDLIEIDIN